LGGFFAMAAPAFDGLPTSRHEAACASGSIALLAAMADIESGRYGTAAVLGLEMMRNVPGETGAAYLGAAAWVGHEYQGARYVWPRAFSELTDEYDRRYGIDEAHLRRISQINFANARLNPNAQTRDYVFNDASFAADDEANPVIEGRVRKSDCGQVTDGAAMVVLASAERAADYARRRGVPLESLPRIKGWGHRSGPISYQRKVEASAGAPYVFPQVKRAIDEARARAGLSLEAIDAVETHDCFAMTEYMAIDHLGLTAPGESWKAIEAGDIEIGGRLPINPSGGLIGCGHPVGATGVRMALDAFRQTTGTAGGGQVEGARNVQTLNIGGSTTTTVSLVIGRD
jgi:acetyl-CoA C-acetyltransferase